MVEEWKPRQDRNHFRMSLDNDSRGLLPDEPRVTQELNRIPETMQAANHYALTGEG
jgi:hypothetical protein